MRMVVRDINGQGYVVPLTGNCNPTQITCNAAKTLQHYSPFAYELQAVLYGLQHILFRVWQAP